MRKILQLFALWCSVAAPILAADLRVGAAAVNITPPPGIGMAGYYFERGAQGTNDDLFSKAIVIESGEERVALVGLDLISTTRPMVEAARKEIEQVTNIRGDHVMISATHAHTGPVLANRGPREAAAGGETDLSRRYSAELPKRIAESVRLAANRLQPARAAIATVREENLSFNRRYFLSDDTVGWNPGKLNSKIVRPAGPIDPDVNVLLFEEARSQRPDAIATYVNFAMHPDTVGGENFSADYPGALSRALAGYQGTNMVTLFANGTCGNINHVDVRWSDPQKGPAEAHRIGTILASDVFRAYRTLQPISPGALRVRSKIVRLPLPHITERDIETARTNEVRMARKEKVAFLDQVQTYKVLDVATRNGKPHDVEVQVIALGDDLAWVSLPGEIFVELGLAIKKASPFKRTLIAELANGAIGYIPNRAAYPQGNYEVVSARCAVGSGELLVEAALKSLNELHSE